ncbi:MAG: hypothetical protein P4L67_00225, partial [Candidatus Pacebacteria bacterium]|nr:hypothetical protein [Candidatus Paceibacterota bacterium]
SPNPETSFFPYNCISLSPNPLLITPPATPPHFDLSDPSPLRFTCDAPAPAPAPASASSAMVPDSSSSYSPASSEKQQKETAIDAPAKKTRGRKRLHVTEEQKKEAMAKRVERNRFFARENRKKKKEYIVILENRVQALTSELEFYKRRVAEFEAREHEYGQNFKQFYQQVKLYAQHFEEQRMLDMALLAQQSAHNISEISHVMKSSIEDKRRMLDMIGETFIDFSFSQPYQRIMNMLEHSSDVVSKECTEDEVGIGTTICGFIVI